jgi:asparagine synthase (glutamine-hydrolysing)
MTISGLDSDDESTAAAEIAAHYGHEHEVVPAHLTEEDLCQYFMAMQRPTIDGLNTYIVSLAVKASGYRVAVSGLGGDEATGGYSHFRALPLLRPLRLTDRVPALTRGLVGVGMRLVSGGRQAKVQRLLLPGGPRTPWDLDFLQREVYSPSWVQAMTGISLDSNDRDAATSDFQALVEAELVNYMQATLLPDADCFSMHSSVELRVPYVDRQFFSAAVNANRWRRRPLGKRLLAQALSDDYLLDICRRPKRGFTVPMSQWMNDGPLRAVADRLQDESSPIWAYVRRDAADPILDAPATVRWSERWALASLNQWLESLSTNPCPSD